MNVVDKNGKTPLNNACDEGNSDIVKFLIESGARMNAVNNDDKTPFHDACCRIF